MGYADFRYAIVSFAPRHAAPIRMLGSGRFKRNRKPAQAADAFVDVPAILAAALVFPAASWIVETHFPAATKHPHRDTGLSWSDGAALHAFTRAVQ